MNRLFINLLALFLILMFTPFTACERVENLQELSEGEAVEIIEAALQEASAGLQQHLEDLVENLEEISIEEVCDSVIVKQDSASSQNPRLTLSYTTDWVFDLSCNGFNIPQAATFTAATTVDYATSRMISDDETSFNGDVNGLALSASAYLINGDYLRDGTQDFIGSSPKTANSLLDMELTNLEVDKGDREILSGTATYSLTGSTSQPFSYTGTITFLGNGDLTLVVNGTTYNISLN